MDSLDLLWGIAAAMAVAFIAYGAVLCLAVHEQPAEESEEASRVNSSHAEPVPGHSEG